LSREAVCRTIDLLLISYCPCI